VKGVRLKVMCRSNQLLLSIAVVFTLWLSPVCIMDALGQGSQPQQDSQKSIEKEVASLQEQASRLMEKREFDQAERLLETALSIAEKEQGAEHRDLSRILNALGQLYFMKQEAARGVPLVERAALHGLHPQARRQGRMG
jgi:flagellar biosynthesis protein FliP